MLFTSLPFFILLIATFIIYYLPLFSRLQLQILIISSLIFYSYENPTLLILLLFSTAINTITSYYVIYGKAERRKLLATLGVVFNLLVLSFFKYSPLLAKTFFKTDHDSVAEFLLGIPLPIGISFFTFEGISLVIDVYKEPHFKKQQTIPESFIRHTQRTIFFISFFPHLISGPILKAHEFLPQIQNKYFKKIDWTFCFKNLILGYFLKMVVADNLKDFTFWMQYPYFQNFSSVTLVFMLVGYSFQIFSDFAGYSIIAIALAKLFGYDLIENFNFPYISTSFSEFWQRWHISLSSFLREYLYIPLGGNRKGKIRTYINLLITMFLGGLWHGAAWSYAMWGLFHGTALVFERIYKDLFSPIRFFPIRILNGLLVFCIVTSAWLFFKLPDFNHVLLFVRSIQTNYSMNDSSELITFIILYSLPAIFYHIVYLLKSHLHFVLTRFDFVLYGIMLALIGLNSGTNGSFIYFQF